MNASTREARANTGAAPRASVERGLDIVTQAALDRNN
jgi:hypothetical protein